MDKIWGEVALKKKLALAFSSSPGICYRGTQSNGVNLSLWSRDDKEQP
jgi:hypothetical protein